MKSFKLSIPLFHYCCLNPHVLRRRYYWNAGPSWDFVACRIVRSNGTLTQVDDDTLNSEPTSVLELSVEPHPESASRVVVAVYEQ